MDVVPAQFPDNGSPVHHAGMYKRTGPCGQPDQVLMSKSSHSVTEDMHPLPVNIIGFRTNDHMIPVFFQEPELNLEPFGITDVIRIKAGNVASTGMFKPRV